jgi:hypothetical protein
MSFADYPTARTWYRAHNGSVVAAYLEHRDLAEAENEAERFFENVVHCRVLYTHGLVAAPRMSSGWLRPLAPFLGDPRLGMTGIVLQLSRVLPDEYPLRDSVRQYLSAQRGFGRLVDFGMIVPSLQQLYQWSAHELAVPGLLHFARGGAMTYAWPFEDRSLAAARVVHSSDDTAGAPTGTTCRSEQAIHVVNGGVRANRKLAERVYEIPVPRQHATGRCGASRSRDRRLTRQAARSR